MQHSMPTIPDKEVRPSYPAQLEFKRREAVEFRRGRKRVDSRSADILEINFEMEGWIEGVRGIPRFPSRTNLSSGNAAFYPSTPSPPPPPFRYLDGVQKWFASNEATLFQRDVPFLPVARVNIGRNSREKRLVSEGVESCFRCTFAFDDFPGDIQRICPLPSNIMFDHRADRIFIFFFCCAAMWRV